MIVVWFQVASVRVVETTAFGIAFIFLPNSPALSSIAGRRNRHQGKCFSRRAARARGADDAPLG